MCSYVINLTFIIIIICFLSLHYSYVVMCRARLSITSYVCNVYIHNNTMMLFVIRNIFFSEYHLFYLFYSYTFCTLMSCGTMERMFCLILEIIFTTYPHCVCNQMNCSLITRTKLFFYYCLIVVLIRVPIMGTIAIVDNFACQTSFTCNYTLCLCCRHYHRFLIYRRDARFYCFILNDTLTINNDSWLTYN